MQFQIGDRVKHAAYGEGEIQGRCFNRCHYNVRLMTRGNVIMLAPETLTPIPAPAPVPAARFRPGDFVRGKSSDTRYVIRAKRVGATGHEYQCESNADGATNWITESVLEYCPIAGGGNERWPGFKVGDKVKSKTTGFRGIVRGVRFEKINPFAKPGVYVERTDGPSSKDWHNSAWLEHDTTADKPKRAIVVGQIWRPAVGYGTGLVKILRVNTYTVDYEWLRPQPTGQYPVGVFSRATSSWHNEWEYVRAHELEPKPGETWTLPGTSSPIRVTKIENELVYGIWTGPGTESFGLRVIDGWKKIEDAKPEPIWYPKFPTLYLKTPEPPEPKKSEDTLAVGDVVCIPSDPDVDMTIIGIGSGNADLVWFTDDREMLKATLPLSVLQRYEN